MSATHRFEVYESAFGYEVVRFVKNPNGTWRELCRHKGRNLVAVFQMFGFDAAGAKQQANQYC